MLSGDISELIGELKRRGAHRVALQFPEGLKRKAAGYAAGLREAGFDVMVSGDPCYGACDLALDSLESADVLVHIGSVLSTMTDIPMTVMRKRVYNLPHEVPVHQTTGYSKGELYLNGVYKGDRVVIIDDVVSTGGTMKALLKALEIAGAEVVDVCIAIQRGEPDIGRPYKSLVKIEVDERVHVVRRYI